MKIYEELTRIKVNEALHSGLAAQKGRNMQADNLRQTRLSAEEQDRLVGRLFVEERLTGVQARKPRLPLLVYIIITLALFVVSVLLVQI